MRNSSEQAQLTLERSRGAASASAGVIVTQHNLGATVEDHRGFAEVQIHSHRCFTGHCSRQDCVVDVGRLDQDTQLLVDLGEQIRYVHCVSTHYGDLSEFSDMDAVVVHLACTIVA